MSGHFVIDILSAMVLPLGVEAINTKSHTIAKRYIYVIIITSDLDSKNKIVNLF